MKSLLLTVFFPPPSIGGSSITLSNIFTRFPAGAVTVFTWSGDPGRPEPPLRMIRRRYIKPGVKGWTKYKKMMMLTLWAIELTALRFTRKPDCVYVGHALPEGFLALFAKHFLRLPYVAFCYGEDLTTCKATGRFRTMIERYFRDADAIIANSSFTKKLLLEIGVEERRISLVCPGVDTSVFRPDLDTTALRSRLGLESARVVLTVARLIRRKGHEYVIRALPKILDQVPNTKYLVVGTDMGEGERLRALVQSLGLSDHVLFVGQVRDEDLPLYYCLCDVFVMANYTTAEENDTEGFGTVFLEANACGKAVVGGRTGGTSDAILHEVTGVLLDPTDIDQLARQVIRLLEDGDHSSRLGENGRRRVMQSFSWEAGAAAVYAAGLRSIKRR